MTKVTKTKAVKEKKVAAIPKTSKKVSVKAPVPEPEVDDMVTPGEDKKDIIVQFQVKEGDTGSPEVQIALLSKRIENLVSHLKSNPSDNHSRRGLLGIVSKRRRLLNYLEKKEEKRFKMITSKLGLGK